MLVAAVALLCSGCAGFARLDREANPHAHLPQGHLVGVKQPMTLPRFLGIDACARKLGSCGRGAVLYCQATGEKIAAVVPALEPPAPPLPMSHPANAESPSPAVAAAHKMKKAKAAKAAKIKAVAFLGSEGCLENPLVEEGILAALDDISADVRIAAVEAVVKSAQRGCDDNCVECSDGCCSELIRCKLTAMVFEMRDNGCYVEPSSKARRLARLALDLCGGPIDCSPVTVVDGPTEVPPPAVMKAVGSE